VRHLPEVAQADLVFDSFGRGTARQREVRHDVADAPAVGTLGIRLRKTFAVAGDPLATEQAEIGQIWTVFVHLLDPLHLLRRLRVFIVKHRACRRAEAATQGPCDPESHVP